MKNVIIRKGRKQDLDQISDLWKDFIDYHADIHAIYSRRKDGHTNAMKFFGECIEAEDHELFVAEDNGRLVGYTLINISEYPPVFLIDKYGLIFDMYVVPEYQRNGIGHMFMEKVIAWFKTRDMKHVHLRVAYANERGNRFWRKLGFKELTYEMKLDL